MSLEEQLERDGFLVVESVVSAGDCTLLCEEIDSLQRRHRAGERRVLERLPEARRVVTEGPLARIIRRLLGEDAFASRATLFDKTAEANWRVGWHQDRIIEMRWSGGARHATTP